MEDLDEVVHSYSMAPHRPGRLCTIPPATLLFEDKSRFPRKIHKLDCTVLPVNTSNQTRPIETLMNNIWDISYTEHEEKQLVLITNGYEGLFAYNGCTGELEWTVKGRVFVGITGDGRGHLFQCVNSHENNAVKMYTTKGSYLGTLQLEKGNVFRPRRISWCKNTSSLVLANERDEEWFVSVIAVKYPM